MSVVTILFIIFVVMGIICLFGKGNFLIAGYNTASKNEKAKYDEGRLNKSFAILCFGTAIVIAMIGYVDTDAFSLYVGLPLIIALIIYIFIAVNTYCKKK